MDVIRTENPKQPKSTSISIYFEVHFFDFDKFVLSLSEKSLRRKGLAHESVHAE